MLLTQLRFDGGNFHPATHEGQCLNINSLQDAKLIIQRPETSQRATQVLHGDELSCVRQYQLPSKTCLSMTLKGRLIRF